MSFRQRQPLDTLVLIAIPPPNLGQEQSHIRSLVPFVSHSASESFPDQQQTRAAAGRELEPEVDRQTDKGQQIYPQVDPKGFTELPFFCVRLSVEWWEMGLFIRNLCA